MSFHESVGLLAICDAIETVEAASASSSSSSLSSSASSLSSASSSSSPSPPPLSRKSFVSSASGRSTKLDFLPRSSSIAHHSNSNHNHNHHRSPKGASANRSQSTSSSASSTSTTTSSSQITAKQAQMPNNLQNQNQNPASAHPKNINNNNSVGASSPSSHPLSHNIHHHTTVTASSPTNAAPHSSSSPSPASSSSSAAVAAARATESADSRLMTPAIDPSFLPIDPAIAASSDSSVSGSAAYTTASLPAISAASLVGVPAAYPLPSSYPSSSLRPEPSPEAVLPFPNSTSSVSGIPAKRKQPQQAYPKRERTTSDQFLAAISKPSVSSNSIPPEFRSEECHICGRIFRGPKSSTHKQQHIRRLHPNDYQPKRGGKKRALAAAAVAVASNSPSPGVVSQQQYHHQQQQQQQQRQHSHQQQQQQYHSQNHMVDMLLPNLDGMAGLSAERHAQSESQYTSAFHTEDTRIRAKIPVVPVVPVVVPALPNGDSSGSVHSRDAVDFSRLQPSESNVVVALSGFVSSAAGDPPSSENTGE
ncbi:uncharacterized protein V1516DRAFT_680007 [Lipomyces oligophaga]|uniref:uncharacterized protein n=1 Tax=Lipomyces oligophaga TaxID=45792 RepID=UPI0034CF9387